MFLTQTVGAESEVAPVGGADGEGARDPAGRGADRALGQAVPGAQLADLLQEQVVPDLARGHHLAGAGTPVPLALPRGPVGGDRLHGPPRRGQAGTDNVQLPAVILLVQLPRSYEAQSPFLVQPTRHQR